MKYTHSRDARRKFNGLVKDSEIIPRLFNFYVILRMIYTLSYSTQMKYYNRDTWRKCNTFVKDSEIILRLMFENVTNFGFSAATNLRAYGHQSCKKMEGPLLWFCVHKNLCHMS